MDVESSLRQSNNDILEPCLKTLDLLNICLKRRRAWAEILVPMGAKLGSFKLHVKFVTRFNVHGFITMYPFIF